MKQYRIKLIKLEGSIKIQIVGRLPTRKQGKCRSITLVTDARFIE